MLVVPGSVRVTAAGRGGGPGRGLHRRRRRVASGRLLDVPGHEPRHSSRPGERSASTSNRNFEGRQGKGGRTHLVSPAGRRGHRRHRPPRRARRPVEPETETAHGQRSPRTPAPRCRCAAATSTPTRSSRPCTSSGSAATGFEDGLFAAWREDPASCSTSPQYDGRDDAGRRPGLRHRLLARARGLGAAGLRLPGRHLAAVRRHLPRQLAQGRPAPGRSCPRPIVAALQDAVEADPSAEVTVDLVEREVRCARARSPPFELDDYTRWRLMGASTTSA